MINTRLRATCVLVGLALLGSACTGEIRETTSARTATEQLLISTAAQRAVNNYQGDIKKLLAGKRVAIDDSRFDAVDKNYVISHLRNVLARNGVTLVNKADVIADAGSKKVADFNPALILELRSGALGIKDADFGFGIPPLPLPVPNTALTTQSPGLYLIYRDKQEGWAKFQFWLYDPQTKTYLAQSADLWGRSYYSKWTFFAIGPLDFSEDIYPEEELVETFN